MNYFSSPISIRPFLITYCLLVFCAHSQAEDTIESFDGIWQQQGYGKILQISGNEVNIYDHNAFECHWSEQVLITDLGKIERLSTEKIIINYGINQYYYTRLNELPNRCINKPINDPLYNLNSLWHTFDENYAFFKDRNIDWKKQYTYTKEQIDKNTDDNKLYNILNNALSQFNDSHVILKKPDYIKQIKTNTAQTKTPTVSKFQLQRDLQKSISKYYLKEENNYNAGIIRWGWINQAVVYIQINAMLLLADYNLPKTQDLRVFFQQYFQVAEKRPYQYQDEVEGANKLFKTIIANISMAKAAILDLRFNGGGKDGAALAIMSHFINEEKIVFSKQAKTLEGLTNPQWTRLIPAANTFSGQVYILSSISTASAAEIMILSSLPHPHIQRIGGRTEGIFSDTLDKTLPNGWQYTLSNEIYLDTKHINYESTGIKPDIDLNYSTNDVQLYQELLSNISDGDSAIELILKKHQ